MEDPRSPLYTRADRTLGLAVEHLTRIYLERHAEEARIAQAPEEGDDADTQAVMPTLDHVALRDYLSDNLELNDTGQPTLRAYKGSLIALKTMSLLSTEAVLDLALLNFLGGRGVVSTTALYVNDPAVLPMIDRRPPGPNEIMFCPVKNLYNEQQIEADDRSDAIIGVIPWQGFYLCRPALVSLRDVENSLKELSALSIPSKDPTVIHAHTFGPH